MTRFLASAFSPLLFAQLALSQADPSHEFLDQIRPTLVENCAACHNPAKAKGPAPFLKAANLNDLESNRGLWRNVAAQLRNRTMPPTASKLTEEDRLRVSSWIEDRLRQTACNAGDFAGSAITRRLNRREYHNTIRDLLGVDFEVNGMFPADGTGGAGFDTNGETLFIPPVLMERYMEAAQQIVDRVVITPALSKTIAAPELRTPLKPGEEFSFSVAFTRKVPMICRRRWTAPMPRQS